MSAVVELSQSAAFDLGRCRGIHPAFPAWRRGRFRHRRKKLRQTDPDCMTNIRQCLNGRVRDATFNRRDVGPIHLCLKRQCLLRFVGVVSALLETFAQGNGERRLMSCGGIWALICHGSQNAHLTTDSRRYKHVKICSVYSTFNRHEGLLFPFGKVCASSLASQNGVPIPPLTSITRSEVA